MSANAGQTLTACMMANSAALNIETPFDFSVSISRVTSTWAVRLKCGSAVSRKNAYWLRRGQVARSIVFKDTPRYSAATRAASSRALAIEYPSAATVIATANPTMTANTGVRPVAGWCSQATSGTTEALAVKAST